MSTLRRNVVWLTISQVATWLVSVVVLVLAPDRLEPVGFGDIGLAVAVVGFFTLLASLGTNPYISRLVARDHSTVRSLVVSGVRLKLVLGPVAAALALGVAWVLGYSDRIITLVAIGCVGMIALLLNEVVVAGLHGMELMARAAIWQTAQVYAGSIGGIIVLLTTESVVAYAAAFAVAGFIPLVGNSITLRPYLSAAPPTPLAKWRPMIIGGAPLMILVVLNLVYSTIDIPILASVSGTEVVGWYSLAYKWIGLPMVAATIIVTAFFPQMSSLFTVDVGRFTALVNRALMAAMFVTLPASIGMVFISEDLLRLLYEQQYANSAVLMQILSLHIPIAALDTILATALIASNRQNRYVLVAGAAAIFNPPLVFFAVTLTQDRYGNGGIGAAIITVTTEMFILCCALTMRTKGVMDSRTLWFGARCLGAVMFMAISLYFVNDVGIIVKVVIGMVTYAAASIALRTASISQLKMLAGQRLTARSMAAGTNDPEGSDDMSDSGVQP
jgi:O-antigen/teichoic acid export membrane protein